MPPHSLGRLVHRVADDRWREHCRLERRRAQHSHRKPRGVQGEPVVRQAHQPPVEIDRAAGVEEAVRHPPVSRELGAERLERFVFAGDNADALRVPDPVGAIPEAVAGGEEGVRADECAAAHGEQFVRLVVKLQVGDCAEGEDRGVGDRDAFVRADDARGAGRRRPRGSDGRKPAYVGRGVVVRTAGSQARPGSRLRTRGRSHCPRKEEDSAEGKQQRRWTKHVFFQNRPEPPSAEGGTGGTTKH